MIQQLGPLWADLGKITVYDHLRTNGSSVTIWIQDGPPNKTFRVTRTSTREEHENGEYELL